MLRTDQLVQKEICMENNFKTNTNVHVSYSEYVNNRKGNDNNPKQDLPYRSKSVEGNEYSGEDSVLEIARNVEFLDNFDFDSNEVDKLEEFVNRDEGNEY